MISTSTIVITVLVIAVLTLSFTTYNLLKKNETSEDIVVGYLTYLDQISRVIEISDEKLKKIDIKGSFASDDEVGFFFKQIKQIQNILNEFKLKEH
tara:strand:- start:40 stop:327 length:288 start_codon:yes stop_codon:yes gene_type:complete